LGQSADGSQREREPEAEYTPHVPLASVHAGFARDNRMMPLVGLRSGWGMGSENKTKNHGDFRIYATVEAGDQASTEIIISSRPLKEGALVRTLPQKLSSSELTGEPVMVRKTNRSSGARRKRRKYQRKQEKANAAQQADEELGARGAFSGESCTGTDVNTGVSSRTKRPLSPGGTPQNAQSRAKCTKQSYKNALNARLQVVVVYKNDPSR